MDYNSEAELWWERITGASLVVNNVVSALDHGKNVFLNVPDDLPWRYKMRSIMEVLFRTKPNTEEVVFVYIDAKDECGGVEPGQFILKKYGRTREVINGYR